MLPFRLIRKSPALSAIAITSLALGIGVNITVYSTAPHGVNPWSPAMFGSVLAVLLTGGAAAACIPARRATAVDPSTALRES